MVHVVRNKMYAMFLHVTLRCRPVLMMQLCAEQFTKMWLEVVENVGRSVATFKNPLDQRHDRSEALIASGVQIGNRQRHHQRTRSSSSSAPSSFGSFPSSHRDGRFPHAAQRVFRFPLSHFLACMLHHWLSDRLRRPRCARTRTRRTQLINIRSEEAGGGEGD